MLSVADRSAGLAGGEDDVVAEGLKLALMAAGLAVLVAVAGVVVRAEVAVAGGGVGEEVPHDDEDGPADRAAFRAAAAGTGGEAAVPLAEEGRRIRGGAAGL